MAQKILIIDDAPDFVQLLESRLKLSNYDVVVAFDGKTGLELAKKEIPDLVILDVVMPGMDGFEVLKVFKGSFETSAIPVIMLTQKRDSESILDAQELGAVDYISKPFDPEELLKLIRRYI
ncbi:MAG: response regulator [Candidatus Omnitrophota bacterium]|nr:response regulator [Candidatus Omnitrophota bacterium]MBU1929032.1 response regulator [Candidatus Omnitrophota bacterium]MBU2035275.1 response regulator [Candidatus Omnitrophota bacterium]MBU2257674.1 response regulator [Candidatus Omnitrophota bacterium]